MTEKRSSSSRRHLSPQELRNLLRGSSSPGATFSKVRQLISLSEISTVLPWLPSIKSKGKGVFAPRFPPNLSSLRRGGVVFEPVELDVEVSWAAQIVRHNATRLNEFLSIIREYEADLIAGRYEKCIEGLDRAESAAGVSMWTLELRFALLQHYRGLESQKAFLAAIRKERSQNDVVSFLAYYISQRNEETTQPVQFSKHIWTMLSAASLSPDFAAYLAYRLLGEIPEAAERCAGILRFEASSALADYYDTLMRLALHSIISNPEGAGHVFSTGLRQLENCVGDWRLCKALYLANGSLGTLQAVSRKDLTLEDAEIEGTLGETEVRDRISRGSGDCLDWYILAGLAHELGMSTLSREAGIAAWVTVSLIRTMGDQADRAESITALERFVLNFRLTCCAPLVDWFLHLELGPRPTRPSSKGLLAFLNSQHLEPFGLRELPDPSDYDSQLARVYEESSSLTSERVRSGLETPALLERAPYIRPEVKRRLLAETALRAGRNEDVLQLLLSADCTNASVRTRRQNARLRTDALLTLDTTPELAEYVVDQILEDPALAHMLPLGECASLVEKAPSEQTAARLSTPILVKLAIDNGESISTVLSDAYEDCLLANGMEKPSQLADRTEAFPHRQLVYYLREICTPSVMHLSSAFSSSREVEDERITICSLLARLDEAHAKDYETEAREITRSQTIRRGVRHAESSKIYVDTDAIHRWADANLRDSYARYLSLLEAGIGMEESSVTEALSDLVLFGTPLPKEFLEVPKNQAYANLIETLRALLHEFAMNPTHGLNCYLSMRIRHGTLSGQLRSPLENEHLITQRESETQEYKPNLYWLERLSDEHPEYKQILTAGLSRLSREYDGFIDRIATKLIQIRSKDKPEGLFSIVITALQLRVLAARIKSDMNFDRFIELSFETFWSSVEVCLKNVRDVIDHELKSEVSAIFGRFEKEVTTASGVRCWAELDGAAKTARTRAQTALDRVKDWFQLSKPLSEPVFTLEELVDIALQMVRNFHREFDPIIEKRIPDLPPFMSALMLFTDLFFIIFDNIRRHSGVPSSPRVEVDVTDLESRLRIRVRSEAARGIQTPDVELKLADIRRAILGDSYPRSVSSEGSTGLIKLGKLVKQDGRGRLDFGFEQEGQFFVDLEMGMKKSQ